MTSTSLISRPDLLAQPSTPSGMSPLIRRLPAALVGLFGAAVLGYGVSQPWVSTFAGQITQSGWSTRNGNLLLAGATLSGLLALVTVVRASTTARWLLALTGFVTVAFGGYLLIQLYTVTQTTDSTTFLEKGPGLYIATAGAAIVFSTIFLPMPATATTAGLVSDPDADATAVPALEPRGMLSAVSSPWRYPAALLSLVAGFAHVPVTPEHLNEAPYIGVLFIVLTVACVVLASALLISDSPAVWAAVGGTCLLAVGAFVLSRTVGLPLIADDIGIWFEPLAVVSVLTEAGVVILSAAVLLRRHRAAKTA